MKNPFSNIIKNLKDDPVIIAEVSGNHQNKLLKLKELIRKISKSEANIIKFQVYKPSTITLNVKKKDFKVEKNSPWKKHKYFYDLYNKAFTPWDWIFDCVHYLNKIKFPWFASIFDETALKFMQKLGCPAYKIASPEINDVNLIKMVAKTKKPIVLSTGAANLADVDLAIKTIRKFHNKIVILKCVSNYPTQFEDLNLKDIILLKKKYNLTIGFSDHTLGSEAAKLAAVLGAEVFEKHFKLNNDKKSIDEHFSMNISEAKYYKNAIIFGKKVAGSNHLLNFKSNRKKIVSSRSLYISEDIEKNKKLKHSNVKSVRPGYSLHPKYLKKIIGKKVKKSLKVGSRIKLSDFY